MLKFVITVQALTALLFFCVSCAVAPKIETFYPDSGVFKTQEVTIHPGQIVLKSFNIPQEVRPKRVICGEDQEVPLFEKNNKANVLIVESYFTDFKSKTCSLLFEYRGFDLKRRLYTTKVKKKKYKRERIMVDKKKVVLSPEDEKRVIKELEIKKKIYLTSSPIPYFKGKYQKPLKSRITSPYGTKRVFNNKKHTHHLGVDFRAKKGTPVPVANDGRVVFVGDLFFSGKVIIVDHGLGIFSMYAHMSKFNTVEGEYVPKGSIIGYSGKTGRVSGPHLHWGIRIQGHWVDGLTLTKIPF